MAKGKSSWYAFVRASVRSVFFGGVTGGLRSVGLEHVPPKGGVIVAPNHVSHLDPPAVACAINRQLCFMAKEELFRGFFGRVITGLGAFPVRRGEGDTDAIRRTIALLEEGRAVLVFPEGTRGDGVTMNPINRGVAMLAKRTGAWVLPVGIVGTHIVLPRGQKKRHRHLVTIAFGQPFHYADFSAESDKDARAAFTSELVRRISKLCGESGYSLRSGFETALPEGPAGPGTEAEAQNSPAAEIPSPH